MISVSCGYPRNGSGQGADSLRTPRMGYLFGAIGVTNRKAPAFLQGLLQFGCSLVGDGGLEPPTPCL